MSLRSGVRAVLPLGKAPGDDYAGYSDADPAFAIAIVMEQAVGQPLVVSFFGWNAERSTITSHPSEYAGC